MRRIISLVVSLVFHALLLAVVLNIKLSYRIYPLKQRLETLKIMPVEKLHYFPVPGKDGSFLRERSLSPPASFEPGGAVSAEEKRGQSVSEDAPPIRSGDTLIPKGDMKTKDPAGLPRGVNLTPSNEKSFREIISPGRGEKSGAGQGTRDLRSYLYPRRYVPFSEATAAGAAKKESKPDASVPGGGFETSFLIPWGEKVVDKIHSVWTAPRFPENRALLEAVVVMTVSKEGSLLSLRLEQSSGDMNMNVSVLEAVKKSVPFPALPPAYPLEKCTVSLVFESDG